MEKTYIGSAGPRPAHTPGVVPQGKCCRNFRGEFLRLQSPPKVDCCCPWIPLILSDLGKSAPWRFPRISFRLASTTLFSKRLVDKNGVFPLRGFFLAFLNRGD